MADIGSLVVKLAAETASFHADLGRSARLVEKHAGEMKASLEGVANVAKGAFALVVGAVSIAALKDFVLHTLEAAAALQDLSEQTGASATALSGFAPVAMISGTAMEAIGVSLTKLSKGLAGVDDETAGASRALKELGIDAKDGSKNLRDPAEVMNDIALKLAEFEDGAGKTAIAMDLFGKSGASVLPFLKDLAENQDLAIRLTADQIEEADKASKAMGRMKAESSFVAQTLVTSAIPAMSALVDAFKDTLFGTDNAVEGIQRLRSDGTLTNWAQNTAQAIATVIDALRAIGHMIKAVIGSFQAVWADVELAGTFLAGGKGLNPFSEENRATLKTALDKRNAIVAQSNKNYVDLWNMPLLTDALTKRFDEIKKGTDATAQASAPKKKLNYNTATSSIAANGMSRIDSDLKRLQGVVDAENDLFKDRQRIIDLYESQGYLSFKEANEARLTAQQDFTEKLRASFEQEEAILNGGLETVAKTTQDRIKLQDKLSEITLKRQKLEREAQQSNLERQIRLPGETLKDLQEQASRSQNELRSAEEQIKTLRESGAISELESLRRLAAARQESGIQLATLAQQAREVAETAPGNEKLADALRKIEEAARQAADGASSLAQRAQELSDPEAGFTKALRTVADEAEQVGKQIESATTKAFNGMTDALVDFVMTGKLNFKSLAMSIISDLIRIQIQRAITMPLANALGGMFGFADGGVMTSAGPLPLARYASGGIASSPQLALFGEGSQAEAYVPLPDGRSIPVTMSRSDGGGDVFNISVSVADAGTSAAGTDTGGRDLGKAIASAVRQELLNQKRAGGLLDARRTA